VAEATPKSPELGHRATIEKVPRSMGRSIAEATDN
jgi:hypothetical protein